MSSLRRMELLCTCCSKQGDCMLRIVSPSGKFENAEWKLKYTSKNAQRTRTFEQGV